jgi:hypothetical protein
VQYIFGVGTAIGYGMGDRDLISGRGKEFSLFHSVQTGSEAHPVSYSMDTGGSFPRGKATGTCLVPRSRMVRL